jgi:hypothetical protein
MVLFVLALALLAPRLFAPKTQEEADTWGRIRATGEANTQQLIADWENTIRTLGSIAVSRAQVQEIATAQPVTTPVPADAPPEVQAMSKSEQLNHELFWKFADEWEGKYWIEPGVGTIQCVGGVKRYMADALGIEYLIWAPTDSYKGFPPLAIRDYLNGMGGIVQPQGTANVPGMGAVPYQIKVIYPGEQLKIGDIVILGRTDQNSWSNPGHTGIFVEYSADKNGVIIFDQNGGSGSSTPGPDSFGFHQFPVSSLNELAIGLRVEFQLP